MSSVSVQQLEKLQRLHTIFENTADSLEKFVACERIQALISRTEEVIQLRSNLRDQRRQLRMQAEGITQHQSVTALVKRPDWFTKLCLPTTNERFKIAVGGMVFEFLRETVAKDPHSLLAELAMHKPGLEVDLEPDIESPDPAVLRASSHAAHMCLQSKSYPQSTIQRTAEGYYSVDREWWLFRRILAFLRDGGSALPDDRVLLAELYRESSFWRLRSLQKAIEETKMHLRPSTAPNKASIASAYTRDSSSTQLSAHTSVAASILRADLNSDLLLKPIASVNKPTVDSGAVSADWWRQPNPSWLQERTRNADRVTGTGGARESKLKEARANKMRTKEAVPDKGDSDWWTGSTYKGRTFKPTLTPQVDTSGLSIQPQSTLPADTSSTTPMRVTQQKNEAVPTRDNDDYTKTDSSFNRISLSATWSVPLPARAQSPKLSEDSASGLEQREYSALMGGGRTGIGSISTGHRSALSANIGYGLSDEIGSGRNSLVPSYAPMYPASPTTESRLQRIGSLDTNIRFNQAHTNTIPVHYRHVNPRPTTSETQHIHYHQQQQNKIDPLGANVVHNSNPSIVTTQGALLGLREDYDSQKEKFLPSHSLSLS